MGTLTGVQPCKSLTVMHPTLAAILLILVPLTPVAGDRPSEAPTQAAKGRLLAVGGGGTTDAIVARALELAGGPKSRMLIVPQASGSEDAGAKSVEFWREKGALDVQVLDLTDRSKAKTAIAEADFLWMPGGDQNRLMSALLEAGVVDAIRDRYRAGALVGGTSAGAAVLSKVMIVGGDTADLTSVRAAGTETAEGLGLWDGALVDQHFLKRQRFNRLMSAVLDHPELVGLGVDEKTGVVLHPDGACEVVGDGSVLVIDARGATRKSVAKGEGHSASGLALAIHRGGDKFALTRPEKR